MKTIFYFLCVWLIFIAGCAVLWLFLSIILPVALAFVINHTFIVPSAEGIVRSGAFWILFVPGIISISYVSLQFLQAKDDELTVYEKIKYFSFFIVSLGAYAYLSLNFVQLLIGKILSH